jgi:DNA-binding transcriptional LysR family regulator
MELRHVRTFVALAEELHFGRAARKLRVVQSAVSQTIRALEEDVGAPLFVRGPGGVRLTIAGEHFLGHARRALGELDEGASTARNAGTGEVGRLALRLGPISGLTILPRVVARFRRELPRVDLRIEPAGAADPIAAVADGRADLAFLSTAKHDHRTEAAETDLYPVPRGACQELLRAGEVLVARGLAPATASRTAGEIALWLVALKRGARPSGWEGELGRAMKDATAYVRQIAMEYAPDSVPAALVPAVAANLAHADQDVVVAAAELAQRAKLASIVPQVLKAMSKPVGLRLNIVSRAAYLLGARFDRARILVGRLSDKAAFDEALSELLDVLEYSGRSSNGQPSDAERAAVQARWKAFVALHRGDIEAGRKLPLNHPSVSADLVPPNWKLGRRDGTQWP